MAAAKLIYGAITSLDGYVADERGNFRWSKPDDEVHAFINDLERPIGTYLYGRKLYETMAGWETARPSTAEGSVSYEYAELWQAASKIVYSTTLERVSTSRTRLERSFDPGTVARLKNEADRDITVGGPNLAAQALLAGLVDECRFFIAPVGVGGGSRVLPEGVRLNFELVDARQFRSGFAFLHYRVLA